jgi:hypothetical protein
MMTGGEAGAVIGAGGMFFGVIVTAILSLVFSYVAAAAIVNFAREDRFGAAFDIATIRTVVLDRDYAISWLVSIVLFIVVGLLGMIPLVGWIVTPFAGFYAAVVAGNLWATGFNQALDTRTDPGHSITEEHTV